MAQFQLPTSDIYAHMAQHATNLTSSKPEEILHEDPTKAIDITGNGDYYYVEKTVHDGTGFQAIIFKDVETGISTVAVGGSYSLAKPFSNPVEWARDWWNNLITGGDRINSQITSTINFVRDNKAAYNIQNLTGFSQGAINVGCAARLAENSDLTAYLYDGGLPSSPVGWVSTHRSRN